MKRKAPAKTKFVVPCRLCDEPTTRTYALAHDGLCRKCNKKDSQ